MKKASQRFRYIVIYAIIALVFIVMAYKLIGLQIVQGAYYLDISKTRTTATLPIKAPRGEIFDRYGRPLVTNRMGFSVVMQKGSGTNSDLNAQILAMINVIKTSGDTYIDTLSLNTVSPYNFTGSDSDTSSLIKMYNLSSDATGQQVLDYMVSKYGISASSEDEAREIAGVRYEMAKRSFSASNPFIFAQDVSDKTVAVFEEQSDSYPGVQIMDEPIPEYTDATLASHIIGRVGVIYAEEYAQLKDQGYSMTDMVGKDGIEKYLEPYLKGTDGVTAVSPSNDGTQVIQPAQMGSYGVLTIDSELQKTMEVSLKNNIIAMRSKSGAEGANAGAAVAIDVNTGEILAMASYPSYDLNTFNQDYASLLANPNKPLFNRAISGTYAPGSTFKVLTALAGLETGVITPSTIIVDQGVFTKYAAQGYAPACWLWNQSHATHGPLTVDQALEVSCNYFFYQVGDWLGIDNLDKYGKAVGLGQTEGIEIGGESAGILAGPAYRTSIGQKWYAGDTLQAAIGQSDNLLTPLQLANYIATIANGGTLYKPHLVKAIKSYDTTKTGGDVQPQVLSKITIDKANYNALMQGMKDVSQSGTAASVFANYKVSVGSKTGTATVTKADVNAVFVAVAPLEHPEIAIAVVVEKGGHGNYAAPIAKDVFDKYFNVDEVSAPIDGVDSLLQ